ncbi:MAG TPA: adventurous gliding motility lipoprotein CglC [Myxococcaceae bacterium]|nr:adventurous gliding motility lipoprotein CglC [Myxococcaceae bacterium]
MPRHRLLAAASVVLVVAVAACTASTELGMPCTPVKALVDGGSTCTPPAPANCVTIGELSAGKDFVSFGATECEDLICVVDQASASQQLSEAQRDAGAGLSSPAAGYCSRACVQGNNSTCTPQFEDMQDIPGNTMTCRELVLDPQIIAAICNLPADAGGNPALCEQYFGSNRSSFFCARGAPADGGI